MIRKLLFASAAPFAVGLIASVVCYLAAGATMGLFLGGFVLVTITAPAIVAQERELWRAIVRGGSIIDGIAIGWLISVFNGIGWGEWLLSYVVLAGYGLAVCGVTMAFSGCGKRKPSFSALPEYREREKNASALRATFALLLGLLWLTWPLWLATTLREHNGENAARWLVAAHPLFAINHVLIDQGAWLENSIIYGHVTLGQDVAYELPSSIVPCVLVHFGLAAALMWVCWTRSSAVTVPLSS